MRYIIWLKKKIDEVVVVKSQRLESKTSNSSGKLIRLYKKMQMPGSVSTSSQPSMFEAILEECSMKQIEIEKSNHEEDEQFPKVSQLFKEKDEHDSSNLWIWMDETPYESILEEEEHQKEENTYEFDRIKSLREEQETKIAQFMRDEKYKSLRCIIPVKGGSPIKGSQSLSPRKTKRIDKAKSFKIIHESD